MRSLRVLSGVLLATTMMPVVMAAVLADVEIPSDEASLQRGAQLATSVCLGCHGFKYLRFGNLQALGFSDEQFDSLRAGQDLDAALDSYTPADVARDLYGVVPPDLSLMAKAREGGPHHVYTLLTSYYTDESGVTDNHLLPGVRMPDVLGYSSAATPGERTELERQALDVVAFLSWAADPKVEQRERLGYFVLGYLVLFAALLYVLKRRIWARLG